MRVLGIDASTTSSGVGIIDDGEHLVHYECIKSPKSKDWEVRTGLMAVRLSEIIKEFKPDIVVVEDVPLKDGKPTIKKLGAVRGAIIASCAFNETALVAVSVRDWRKEAGFFDGTVKGLKREEMKAKAIKLVNKLYGIEVNDDIAEGILIAKTYCTP